MADDYVADLLSAFEKRYDEIAAMDDEGDVCEREFLRGRKAECQYAKRMIERAIVEGFVQLTRRREG